MFGFVYITEQFESALLTRYNTGLALRLGNTVSVMGLASVIFWPVFLHERVGAAPLLGAWPYVVGESDHPDLGRYRRRAAHVYPGGAGSQARKVCVRALGKGGGKTRSSTWASQANNISIQRRCEHGVLVTRATGRHLIQSTKGLVGFKMFVIISEICCRFITLTQF